MRLEQLTYLLMVEHTKSLNLAAEKCHLSQQALSLALKNLEEEFGAKFLERSHNGVHLTEDGVYMVKVAKEVTGLLDEAKAQFKKKVLLKGRLNLYYMPGVYSQLLIQVVSAFSKKHPQVVIKMIQKDMLAILKLLKEEESEEVDQENLYLVNLTPLDEVWLEGEEAICFTPLLENEFVACVSRKGPFGEEKVLSMKKILKQPLILYSKGEVTYNTLYQMLELYGAPKVVLVVDNDVSYYQSISDGIGIGFMPNNFPDYSFENKIMADLRQVKIKEGIKTSIGLLLPPSGSGLMVSDFMEIAQSYLNGTHDL